MLAGIAKAVIILTIAVVADHYLYGGLYTDAALSMLRQIRHSTIW
jgi:hypothetical protein